MDRPYPGQLARQRCANRTRAELMEYSPKRPLPLRDELRIKAMLDRCETCGACPIVIKSLTIMAPRAVEAGAAGAEIIRLAG